MYEFAVTPAVTQLRRPGVIITEVAPGSLGEELRLEILKSRVAAVRLHHHGFDVPPAVLEYLAKSITHNGRDLEGAINRLLAHNTLSSQPVTLEMAEREVRDLPWRKYQTFVIIEFYRVKCPRCGLKVEAVPQLPSKAPFSKDFEDAVGLACESAAARPVARQFGLAASTVRAIDLRYWERWAQQRRKPRPHEAAAHLVAAGRELEGRTALLLDDRRGAAVDAHLLRPEHGPAGQRETPAPVGVRPDLRELPGGHVRFDVPVLPGHPDRVITIDARVTRRGRVRSSSGEVRPRVFVSASIRLGPHERQVELGLVDRRQMQFPMLIGRSAIARACLVDVSRTYLITGKPKTRKQKELQRTIAAREQRLARRKPEAARVVGGHARDGGRRRSP